MAWLIGADPASLGGDIPSMCRKGYLKVKALGKTICDVCNWIEWNEQIQDWEEDCDLVLGAIDVEPLNELVYYLYNSALLDDHLVLNTMKCAIEVMLKTILDMLGLGSMRVKVVHKINDDLPQFAVKDIDKVDKNQLIFKSPADLMRIGIYFSASDEFDPDEFVAFNNLVKYALDTGSIKAILFFKGIFPYDPYGDYYWAIIYNQGTGGDGT